MVNIYIKNITINIYCRISALKHLTETPYTECKLLVPRVQMLRSLTIPTTETSVQPILVFLVQTNKTNLIIPIIQFAMFNILLQIKEIEILNIYIYIYIYIYIKQNKFKKRTISILVSLIWTNRHTKIHRYIYIYIYIFNNLYTYYPCQLFATQTQY